MKYMFELMNDKEIRSYISLMFDGYLKRKEEKRLYNYDGIPEIIIKAYYSYADKASFSNIVENFKKRYIYHENKIEDVHSKEEQKGLGYVYNYIQKKVDFETISIYDLSYIHEELYSKTPYPEFGGKYRNQDVYLMSEDGKELGNIELCPYWNITHEMNLLKPKVDELVKFGIHIAESNNVNDLIKYIDSCIRIMCQIIKIHPFKDGNGRATRAFLNLLFKVVDIPPVYVENKENIKYREAMQLALSDDDYSKIEEFYHFKICDSIISLDVRMKGMVFADSQTEGSKKLGK